MGWMDAGGWWSDCCPGAGDGAEHLCGCSAKRVGFSALRAVLGAPRHCRCSGASSRGRPGHRGGTRSPAQGLGPEVACRSHRSDGQGGERWLKHPSPCAETPVALLSLSAGSVREQPGEKGLPRGTPESPQIPSEAPGSPHVWFKRV